ncbi:MAG: HAMP domain-containing sensor histidine kinase [Coriobacteriaceae bacterium]|nr:HAMP domain-containing sensor histidine kinase [Coriobacteriaceae bacterium]
MLAQLRRKFIALNMTIATLVLLVVFGAICVIDYQTSVSDVLGQLNLTVDRTAESISTGKGAEDVRASNNESENDLLGSAPSKNAQSESEGTATNPAEDTANAQDSENGGYSASGIPVIGKHPEDERNHPPAAIYLVRKDGTIERISSSTASLSSDLSDAAIDTVRSSHLREGFLKDLGLFYATAYIPDGLLVAFADEGMASSWKSLALTFAIVGAGALGAFFLISIFFSRWALKPVEAAWTQQQQFVADASHELKTPLTVILANSTILKARPKETIENQSQWIDSTQSEALRMQELVNDMLELARPASAAKDGQAPEDVDFTDLVENLALQFESVAFEKGVSIECQIEPGVKVQGSRKRLQRLASTLIDNACKYARSDSSVTVKLSKSAKDATLSVHNEGQSIPAEDLPHIFDRFYRTDKARTSDTGGFGLGLAIAREVAREHGGDICAESSQKKGTTFSATIALHQ